MPHILIQRQHQLGLPRARALARRWMADGASRYDLLCTLAEGPSSDTVHFRRSGASGRLLVSATHLELEVSLGFLLAGFKPAIQAKIETKLDALLSQA